MLKRCGSLISRYGSFRGLPRLSSVASSFRMFGVAKNNEYDPFQQVSCTTSSKLEKAEMISTKNRLYVDEIALIKNSKKARKTGMRKISTELTMQKPAEILEMKAFCTAAEYNLDAMLPFLQKNYVVSSQYCDDMMHVVLKDPKSISSSMEQYPHFSKRGEVFFHKNGSFVTWNVRESEISKIMNEIKDFEINPYESLESENLSYCYTNDITTTKGDLVYINNTKDPHDIFRDKFAFSHGMVNCVKLGILENQLDKHIESVRHVPEHMQLGKGIPIDRQTVLVKIGELLSFRAQLNLHSEIIETPEIYWDEPEQEDLYNRVTRILELRQRVTLLNRKLDYANEFSEVLRNHLGESHSHNLEQWITFLIIIEVIFGFFHFFNFDSAKFYSMFLQ